MPALRGYMTPDGPVMSAKTSVGLVEVFDARRDHQWVSGRVTLNNGRIYEALVPSDLMPADSRDFDSDAAEIVQISVDTTLKTRGRTGFLVDDAPKVVEVPKVVVEATKAVEATK